MTEAARTADAAPQGAADRCEVNIQWKGTDACYDFWCPCGWEGANDPNDGSPNNHRDGYFRQEFQCDGCGRWWHLSNRAYAAPGKFFHQEPRHRDGYGCADCDQAHCPSPGLLRSRLPSE